MKNPFPTFYVSSAEGKTIFVSAGRVGMQAELACSDLVRITGGSFARLTHEEL